MFFCNVYNEIFQEFNSIKFSKSEVYPSLHFQKTREQGAEPDSIYGVLDSRGAVKVQLA